MGRLTQVCRGFYCIFHYGLPHDFMKTTRFHEIHRISCKVWFSFWSSVWLLVWFSFWFSDLFSLQFPLTIGSFHIKISDFHSLNPPIGVHRKQSFWWVEQWKPWNHNENHNENSENHSQNSNENCNENNENCNENHKENCSENCNENQQNELYGGHQSIGLLYITKDQ